MQTLQKYILSLLMFVITVSMYAMDGREQQALSLQAIVAKQGQAELEQASSLQNVVATRAPLKKRAKLNLYSDILSEGLVKKKIVEYLCSYARPSLVFSKDRALLPWIIVKQRDAIVKSVQSDDYDGFKKAGRLLDFYRGLLHFCDEKKSDFIPSSFNFVKNYRKPFYEKFQQTMFDETKKPKIDIDDIEERFDLFDFNFLSELKNSGQTLLHEAYDPAVMSLLLHIGISANVEDQYGKTPLYGLASIFGKYNGLELVALEDLSTDKPLHRLDDISRNVKDADRVKLLLDSGANVSKDIPLLYYAVKGNTEVVKLLLDRGASGEFINIEDDKNLTKYEIYDHPLYDAIYYGHVEVVKLLLNHGVDRFWKPLDDEYEYSCSYILGNLIVNEPEGIEMIKILLDDGIAIDLEFDDFDDFINDDVYEVWRIIDNKKIEELRKKIDSEKVLGFEEFTTNPEIKALIAQARIDRAQKAALENENKKDS